MGASCLRHAILSQKYLPIAPHCRRAQPLASATGLLAILIPAALYTADTTFPGMTALPPCLGACLIIAAGETGPSLISRILSLRPFVFFGLISYSLYLWHWPVQVFANFHRIQTCSSLACDAPIRSHHADRRIRTLCHPRHTLLALRRKPHSARRRLRPGRRSHFLTSSFAGGLVAAALMLLATHGEPTRFSPQAVQAATYLDFDTYTPWRWNACALGLDLASSASFDQKRCLPYTPDHPHYLLLGDSHAAHLWPGLAAVFPDLEIGQANVAGCNLLPGRTSDRSPVCRQMANFIYRDLLPRHGIDTIIFSALWHDNDFPEIGRLADYAHQRHIRLVLIGPSVAYSLPLPRILAEETSPAQPYANPEDQKLDARMSTLAHTPCGRSNTSPSSTTSAEQTARLTPILASRCCSTPTTSPPAVPPSSPNPCATATNSRSTETPHPSNLTPRPLKQTRLLPPSSIAHCSSLNKALNPPQNAKRRDPKGLAAL